MATFQGTFASTTYGSWLAGGRVTMKLRPRSHPHPYRAQGTLTYTGLYRYQQSRQLELDIQPQRHEFTCHFVTPPQAPLQNHAVPHGEGVLVFTPTTWTASTLEGTWRLSHPADHGTFQLTTAPAVAASSCPVQ